MFSFKYRLLRSILAVSSGAMMLSGVILVVPSVQAIPEQWTNANYQPPAGLGTPGRTETGGTRGPGEGKLMALLPVGQSFGVTIEENPTILAYLPALADQANERTMEFELMDENGKTFYKVNNLIADGRSQVVSIKVPKNLVLDKDYYWLLSVYDETDALAGEADGWIRRVPQPQEVAILPSNASLQIKGKALADAGIWYDAIATLAKAYRDNPNNPDVKADFQKLLKAGGLENFTPVFVASELLEVSEPVARRDR